MRSIDSAHLCTNRILKGGEAGFVGNFLWISNDIFSFNGGNRQCLGWKMPRNLPGWKMSIVYLALYIWTLKKLQKKIHQRSLSKFGTKFCKVMAAGWTAGALASSTANGFLRSIIDNNQDEIYEATSISFHGSNVQNERCHRRTIFAMEQWDFVWNVSLERTYGTFLLYV